MAQKRKRTAPKSAAGSGLDAEPLRDRITACCRSLGPGVTAETLNGHSGFKTKSKRFLWFVVDHHGDGRIALHAPVPPEQKAAMLRTKDARFFDPPYLGKQGWVGCYLDVTPIDWPLVEELIADAHRWVTRRR